jgi:sporadic carbohydrate cluster protein (TIGR04323 family)
MPTGAQNVLMRAYAARHDLQFLAPIHEDFWVRRFALRSLLEQLSEIEGVIMTSLFTMPSDREIRHAAFRRFHETGATLHCVIENLVVHDAASIDAAEEIYTAYLTVSKCPQFIPKTLLPPIDGYSSFSDKGL